LAESNNIILLYLFFMCGADCGGEKENTEKHWEEAMAVNMVMI
jgi:hypothetical protein